MLPNNHGISAIWKHKASQKCGAFLFTKFSKNSIIAKAKFVEKDRIMREKLKQRIIKYLVISLIILILIIIISHMNSLDNTFNLALIYAGGSIIIYYIICIFTYIIMLFKKNYDDFYLRMMLISIFATTISLFGTTVVLIIKEVLTSRATGVAKIFISFVLLVMASIGAIFLYFWYNIRKRLYIEELENVLD